MQKEELAVYINQFCLHVYEFERALAKQFQTEHSLVYDSWSKHIPRMGTIDINGQIWDYRFHGAGCALTFGKTQVDYDYAPMDTNTIKISEFYLEQFIHSVQPEQELKKEITEVLLYDLVKEGLLQKREWGDFEFDRKNLRF